MTLEELDLSVRTYHLLRKNGITTVEELVDKNEHELAALRGMGRKSLDEIIRVREHILGKES
jgi:DNA-directed RNA polymerase subunit alpha